jgi:AAA15 family ATPase/GTPase
MSKSNKQALIIGGVMLAFMVLMGSAMVSVIKDDIKEDEQSEEGTKVKKSDGENEIQHKKQDEKKEIKEENKHIKEEIKISDEEKKKLISFYEDILRKTKIADDAYVKWSDGMKTNTGIQAYMEAEELKKTIKKQRSQIDSLKIPDVNISKEDKKELKKALLDLSTGYFTKIEAVEAFQEYLNTQSMKSLAKAKEEIETSNNFLLYGTARLVQAFLKYEIDLENISK